MSSVVFGCGCHSGFSISFLYKATFSSARTLPGSEEKRHFPISNRGSKKQMSWSIRGDVSPVTSGGFSYPCERILTVAVVCHKIRFPGCTRDLVQMRSKITKKKTVRTCRMKPSGRNVWSEWKNKTLVLCQIYVTSCWSRTSLKCMFESPSKAIFIAQLKKTHKLGPSGERIIT